VPTPDAIGASELGLSASAAETLLSIDKGDWLREAVEQGEFLARFGERLPAEVSAEHRALQDRLNRS
jgi:phosphoenolpyruvate carboxykinase (GTP)